MCQVSPSGDCLIHGHIGNSLWVPGSLSPVAPAHGIIGEEGVVDRAAKEIINSIIWTYIM